MAYRVSPRIAECMLVDRLAAEPFWCKVLPAPWGCAQLRWRGMQGHA